MPLYLWAFLKSKPNTVLRGSHTIHHALWYITQPGTANNLCHSDGSIGCTHRMLITFLPVECISFSSDQAAQWMVQSVRLSVCPSQLFHYVPIIVSSWNFQELFILTHGFEMRQRAWYGIEEVPYRFFPCHLLNIRSRGLTNGWFESNLSHITRPIAAIKSLSFVFFCDFVQSPATLEQVHTVLFPMSEITVLISYFNGKVLFWGSIS